MRCIAVLTLFVAAVVAGCGNSDGSTDGGGGGDGGATKDLSMAQNKGDAGQMGNPDGGGGGNGFFPSGPNGAPWTVDVSGANGTLDGESKQVIAWLDQKGWGNGGHFQIDLSFHILEADANTPKLTISETMPYTLPDCDEAANLPVPLMGAIEGSMDYTCDWMNNDCHMLIVDRGAHKLYETYQTTITNNTVTLGCLVIWDLTRVYPASGRGEQCTSADAAGFPIAPLLFTADEVAAGHIDHAIRFALPNASMRLKTYVHPASHAGAPSAASPAPPYGAHLRLRQDYPIDSLPSPTAKVVAAALQKYGMFLADGGNIALMGTSDQFTKAKWNGLMNTTRDLDVIKPGDFEMLDGGARIPLTYDCVRNP